MPQITETVQRYMIADYLNIEKSGTESYVLMGTGFNTLDENPTAQNQETIYISDKSATNYIKSYKPVFAFDTDLIASEEAVMALYDVGRNRRTGSDAEFDYVRVELFKPVSGSENTYEARKFRVSCEVSGVSGSGGETIKVTGNLNGVGDFTDGTFNITTKAFTPKTTVQGE